MAMNVVWKFGEYLQVLLERRGWKPSRLAKEAGLSHTYISYLINGVDPSTGKSPSPTIDKLLALAKALNVPIINLVLAYQGKDPDILSQDTTPQQLSEEAMLEALMEFAKRRKGE